MWNQLFQWIKAFKGGINTMIDYLFSPPSYKHFAKYAIREKAKKKGKHEHNFSYSVEFRNGKAVWYCKCGDEEEEFEDSQP